MVERVGVFFIITCIFFDILIYLYHNHENKKWGVYGPKRVDQKQL